MADTPSIQAVLRLAAEKSASVQRHCLFYLASNGRWYMELGDFEYADSEDSTTYGPFPSQDAAERYLKDTHSNPGGYDEDDSGTRPPPKNSPNGRPVQKPSDGGFGGGYGGGWGGRRWADDAAKRLAAEYLKTSAEPPLHMAAKADEALGEAYRSLVALKMGFDTWQEIPASVQPLYDWIGKSISAVVEARKSTTQVREMVRLRRF